MNSRSVLDSVSRNISDVRTIQVAAYKEIPETAARSGVRCPHSTLPEERQFFLSQADYVTRL